MSKLLLLCFDISVFFISEVTHSVYDQINKSEFANLSLTLHVSITYHKIT